MSDIDSPFEEIMATPGYSECINRGYQISYGAPTPLGKRLGNQKALYCKNYQEIIDALINENQDKKTR